jgi:hypothetical protein
VGRGALRIAYAHPNSHSHSNCHLHAHTYGYSHLYTYGYSDRNCDVNSYSYGNIHADPNSDCYSGNPDSDANLHTERDLVRHFERFWYRGG